MAADQSLVNIQMSHLGQLEQAAKGFRRNNTIETLEFIDTPFDEVAKINVEQTWLNQLDNQRKLVRGKAAEADAGLSKLTMIEVTFLAKALQKAYLADIAEIL